MGESKTNEGRGQFSVAVLTVSDRCWRADAVDRSGPDLARAVREKLGWEVRHQCCVPDELRMISMQIRMWAVGPEPVDLVLTTGGTGLAARDVTPEATRSILHKEHPGLIQLMQIRCMAHTPLTFLSRGVAGAVGRTLVINLPGSPKGAVQGLEALVDVLPHALGVLRGDVKDHGGSAG